MAVPKDKSEKGILLIPDFMGYELVNTKLYLLPYQILSVLNAYNFAIESLISSPPTVS